MTPAVVLYEAVGVVADLATRTRRRIGWTIEDVRGLWSALTALPWVPEDTEPPVTGYQPPMLERILPNPPPRITDEATPEELDRVLAEILSEGVVSHACPLRGSGVTPCCGRPPFELPGSDRLTLHPSLVTCTGGETA